MSGRERTEHCNSGRERGRVVTGDGATRDGEEVLRETRVWPSVVRAFSHAAPANSSAHRPYSLQMLCACGFFFLCRWFLFSFSAPQPHDSEKFPSFEIFFPPVFFCFFSSGFPSWQFLPSSFKVFSVFSPRYCLPLPQKFSPLFSPWQFLIVQPIYRQRRDGARHRGVVQKWDIMWGSGL